MSDLETCGRCGWSAPVAEINTHEPTCNGGDEPPRRRTRAPRRRSAGRPRARHRHAGPLGALVRAVDAAGLSCAEVGALLGLCASQASLLLAGRRRLRLDQADALARALGVEVVLGRRRRRSTAATSTSAMQDGARGPRGARA